MPDYLLTGVDRDALLADLDKLASLAGGVLSRATRPRNLLRGLEPVPDTPTPPAPDPFYREGWGAPAFLDDFAVDGVPDPAKWHRRGLPASDYYLSNTDTQGVIVADNAAVRGGQLVLRTERRDAPLVTPDGRSRTRNTAYVDTMPRTGWPGFAQRYGRFEARIRSLHPGDTAGIWPAFWLRTNEDGGEVDILETLGTPAGHAEDGSTAGTWPYAKRFPDDGSGAQTCYFEQTGKTANTPGNAYHESQYQIVPDAWHTWALEWTPDRMTTYCDDKLVGEIRRGVQPTYLNGKPNGAIADGALILDGGWGGDAKAHIRLCVQVGFPGYGMASDALTVPKHEFLVDYVAVYPYNGQR